MADEADIANDTADRMLQEARRQQAALAAANKLQPTGQCHYCAEPLDSTALFCDADCRNGFEEEKRLRNRR